LSADHQMPAAAVYRRLHHREWGRRDNPRVAVCMHGHGRTAQDFELLARGLSEHFRVICPQFGPQFGPHFGPQSVDLDGRGRSDATAETDFPRMLAALEGLMFDLGIYEVDWIGASLGGILGMHLAVQPGVSIRRLVMKNIGEGLPPDRSRPTGQSLSAPLAGVHSVDLWKRIKCPTVLLRGDAPAVSHCEAIAIRGFLMRDVNAPRDELHACMAA
jgi:pimeloyl-ACP methyl ester carboxylesterase